MMMRGFRYGRLLVAIFAVLSVSPIAVAGRHPPISFVGQTYDFYKKEKINLGWAIYFAPKGQNPDRADQAIIVNYYDSQDGRGNVISAEGVARTVVEQDKAKGATFLPSFATPDPLNKGKYNFFISLYYIYPQDKNGDIWIGKVSQVGNNVVGMLYKQQVYGADSAAIAESVKNWLIQNLKTYGTALGELAAPPAPAD